MSWGVGSGMIICASKGKGNEIYAIIPNVLLFNKCKYSSYIQFREKIDFPWGGIKPTPLTVQVSVLPVRPPGTIPSPIAQQKAIFM